MLTFMPSKNLEFANKYAHNLKQVLPTAALDTAFCTCSFTFDGDKVSTRLTTYQRLPADSIFRRSMRGEIVAEESINAKLDNGGNLILQSFNEDLTLELVAFYFRSQKGFENGTLTLMDILKEFPETLVEV